MPVEKKTTSLFRRKASIAAVGLVCAGVTSVAAWNNVSLARPNLLATKPELSAEIAKASPQNINQAPLPIQTLKMSHNLSLTSPQQPSLAAK
jgi:hypothetical protein